MTTYRGESVDTHSLLNDLSSFSVKSNVRINAELAEETLEVYLRIRNRTNDETANNVSMLPYHVDDDKHLILQAVQNTNSRLSKFNHKYTFTKVFDAASAQEDIFRHVGLPIVSDFLEGNNRLLFNYGVTNAGKTLTMQGNVSEPGIIPRALDQLFHRIGNQISKLPKFKPQDGSLVKINLSDVTKEMELKTSIMKMNLTAYSADISMRLANKSVDSSIFNHSNSSQSSESIISNSTLSTHSNTREFKYSVWVSFVEIYSEQIFDLLDSLSNKPRKTLKLRESENGSAFIQGVTEVLVSTAEEAYKVLLLGQHSLRLASTKLNHCSSRSHCIFTLKLVKVYEDSTKQIKQLAFCDLAGAERCSKTQNVGDRLREAGIINTSLMVLGRCINNLRHNQTSNQEIVVPFRDSKLTKIFKNFLTGGLGKASMLINISPCMDMLDETLNVLKFSAMAKELTLPACQTFFKNEPITRSSIIALRKSLLNDGDSIPWEENGESTQQMDDSRDTLNDDSELENEKAMMELIEFLKSHVNKLNKDLLQLEIDIRDELCTEFAKQLKDTEDYYRNRIAEEQEDAQESMEKRLNLLADYYRSKTCSECEARANLATGDISIQCVLMEDKADEETEETANIIVNSNEELAHNNENLKNEMAVLKEKLTQAENKYSEYTMLPKMEEMSKAAISQTDVAVETDKGEFVECYVQTMPATESIASDSDSNIKSDSERRQSTYYSVVGSSPESRGKNFKSPSNLLIADEKIPEMAHYVKSTFEIVTDIQQQLQSFIGYSKKESMTSIQPDVPVIKMSDFSQNTSPVVNATELSQNKLIKKLQSDNLGLEQANIDLTIEMEKLSRENAELKSKSEELTNQIGELMKASEVNTGSSPAIDINATENPSQLSNEIGGSSYPAELSSEEMEEVAVITRSTKKRKAAEPSKKRAPQSKKITFSSDESDIDISVPKSKGRKKLHRLVTPTVTVSPVTFSEKSKPTDHQRVLRNLRKRK